MVPVAGRRSADGEQLGEDGALVPEDGVDGLDSHVRFLGDGGDGCSGIAVSDEEALRGGQQAMPGGVGLTGPAASSGLEQRGLVRRQVSPEDGRGVDRRRVAHRSTPDGRQLGGAQPMYSSARRLNSHLPPAWRNTS